MADPRRSHIHQLPSADSQGAQAGRAASPEGLLQQFLARTQQQQRPGWGDAARYDLERLQAAGQGIMANTQAAAQANQDHLLPKPSPEANWLQRMLYNATAAQANAGVHQSNLAQGAVMHGLGQMAENEGLVQSWVDPLEGPSRVAGSVIAGRNPFVGGRIEGPTVSEALADRGVHPLLAMAAEFLVPDPLGATRALDIIPMLGVIAGFRGLRSLVPSAANDVEAIRAIIKGSPNLSASYMELTDPDAAMQVAQSIYANVGSIADPADAAAAMRAADRLAVEARGTQYTASRQVVPVEDYRPGYGTDILAALGASGQIADIPRASIRRSIYHDLLGEILELPASGWTNGADPEVDARILHVLEAASALPDAKGHTASVALQHAASGAADAGLHVADALDALGVALGHEVIAINNNLTLLETYAPDIQALMRGQVVAHSDADIVAAYRADLEHLADVSAKNLLTIANADHPGSALSGVAMRHYQRAVDEAERLLDELDSFAMIADAAAQIPRTLDESLALMGERMGLTGGASDEHMAFWADKAGSQEELRSMVSMFLDNPTEIDQVTSHLWHGMRIDPLTGQPMARTLNAAELDPKALRGAAADVAGSLGMSLEELMARAADTTPGARESLRQSILNSMSGMEPERVDAMLDHIASDVGMMSRLVEIARTPPRRAPDLSSPEVLKRIESVTGGDPDHPLMGSDLSLSVEDITRMLGGDEYDEQTRDLALALWAQTRGAHLPERLMDEARALDNPVVFEAVQVLKEEIDAGFGLPDFPGGIDRGHAARVDAASEILAAYSQAGLTENPTPYRELAEFAVGKREKVEVEDTLDAVYETLGVMINRLGDAVDLEVTHKPGGEMVQTWTWLEPLPPPRRPPLFDSHNPGMIPPSASMRTLDSAPPSAPPSDPPRDYFLSPLPREVPAEETATLDEVLEFLGFDPAWWGNEHRRIADEYRGLNWRQTREKLATSRLFPDDPEQYLGDRELLLDKLADDVFMLSRSLTDPD